jgi:hypothetical protein
MTDGEKEEIHKLLTYPSGWPLFHISSPERQPVPYHLGQNLGHFADTRYVCLSAGTQSGKTSYGPWWLEREIRHRTSYDEEGNPILAGDYIAATSSYPLFDRKMLPEMLRVFEDILGIGRYWALTQTIELAHPEKGFLASKAREGHKMFGRILLGSASSVSALEASTARAAWLDEPGQEEFGIDAWRAIKRRLSLARGRVLFTSTLYYLGWLVSEILDKAEEGAPSVTYEVNGGELDHTVNRKADITLVQFDSIINPMFAMDEFKEAEESLPDDEFAMYYRGRKAKQRFLIYDSFDESKHTCPRFEIPATWKTYWGLDFGDVNTAVLKYAEDPDTKTLYCYSEYHDGGKTFKQHAEDLKDGEIRRPSYAVGGAGSEGQWRREFAQQGINVLQPQFSDVWLGINIVYACHKQDEIIYFDDLQGVIGQKKTYKKRKNRMGEPIREIQNKKEYHFLDAERYIIGRIRAGIQPWSRGMANG